MYKAAAWIVRIWIAAVMALITAVLAVIFSPFLVADAMRRRRKDLSVQKPEDIR